MSRERRVVGAVVAAVAVTGIVVWLILTVGIRSIPDYPTMTERPLAGISGTVAVVRWAEELPGGPCLYLIAATGGPERRLACSEAMYIEKGFAFTDEGHPVVVLAGPGGTERVEFDPDTGEVLSRTPVTGGDMVEPGWPEAPVQRADGAVLTTTSTKGHTTVTMVLDGERTTLLEATGPRDYAFWQARWSPDGRFVQVTDSEQRVIVVPADGSGEARVLTTGADLLAWYQPGT